MKYRLFAYILLILATFNQSAGATTIAWNASTKVLACDTQMTAGHRKCKCATKIWYSPTRHAYLGAAGTVQDIMAVKKWFLDPKHFDEKTADIKGNFDILIVYEDGKAQLYSEDMSKEPVDIDDNYAIGSGSEFAIAAMACGLDADAAIKLASKLDIGTNDDVKRFQVVKASHFKAPDNLPHVVVNKDEE